MNSIPRRICFLVAVLALASAAIPTSIALGPTAPIGPNWINVINSTRINNLSYMPKWVIAEAGNITELYINATTVTRAWAGFFGNITGQIVLQDSNNYTFYQWANLEPQGEIYASTNSSVNWPTIRCYNHTSDEGYTANGTSFIAQNINSTIENMRYGIVDTDPDAINATFNRTTHNGFHVGTVDIAPNSCYNTWTFINSSWQMEHFNEVLLTDGSPAAGGGAALVFTTIIENDDPSNDTDVNGFDTNQHDFQMLVAEDGHPGAGEDQSTTYYFWVELS